MSRIKKWKFNGVFSDGERILTKNLAPSHAVYGEELVEFEGDEYRVWNPKRSKACAMLKKGSDLFPVSQNSKILYLGAASGTTASHISDIAEDGMVFCIEFSKRAFYDLVDVCEVRGNMVPIYADATKPLMYKTIVGKVDIVYQDVSQRDQGGIFLKNVTHFLKSKGFGILMVKARSIDVTAKPKEIFKKTARELQKGGLEVLQSIPLKPYEKDHAAILVKKIIS
jgi:fibrillarin-like pre-rRNA processing protein